MRTKAQWVVTGTLIAMLAGICNAQDAESPNAPPEDAPKPAAIEEESDEVPLEKLPDAESKSSRKIGRFYVEGGVWFAQPSGLEFQPAIAYQNGVEALILEMPFESETPPRWRFAWEIPDGLGEIIGTYFGYTQEQSLTASAPGQYVYGEIEAFPLYAGAFDNGLADGFAAQARTQVRETRFDFAREVWNGPHVRGKWFAGFRLLSQKWSLHTQYYSLVQPPELFPPVFPPRADLAPLPDVASNDSDYTGRGLEGGLELRFPFDDRGRFSIEAGFSVAAMRGTLRTETFAQTHYYLLTFEGERYVLAPPFDIFTQQILPSDGGEPVDAITYITQESAAIALTGNSVSRSSFAVDAYLGFRWKIWHELELFGGYRDQQYDDAGETIRPASATVLPNGSVNVQSVTRTPISTTYEGFYLGVGFTF